MSRHRRRRQVRGGVVMAVVIIALLASGSPEGIAAGVLLALGFTAYLARGSKRQLPRWRPAPQGGGHAPGFSKETRRRIWIRDGGRCRYCGITDAECMARSGEHLHFDHVVPGSWGGPDTEENGQLACPEYNLAKGARWAG